jgi:formate dehydrogenase iron-sulfur subunit
LSHGEAPACVQSCPNEAIRITLVDQAQAIESAQAAAFIPGAPSPGDTLPTTQYETRKARPRNLLPADFYALNPEHSHPALVVMLVLTQLSVGAFCADYVFGTSNALFALVLGVAAMSASVLHLGRPLYAFRAFLGLRTSWLSREILGFTLFALVATLYAASRWLPRFQHIQPGLQVAVGAIGFAAVGCSIMVYAVTQREGWRAPTTAFKFLSSTLILGTATVVMSSLLFGVRGSPLLLPCQVLAVASALKLVVELSVFRHLRKRQHTALKRTAMLMAGDLGRATKLRFACSTLGGVLLPALVWLSRPDASHGIAWGAVGVALFLLALSGELLERYLFFAASTAPKMPGGPA